MNADNKHGMCCSCPALMADGRFLTQWEPRSTFSTRLFQSTNIPDNEALRYALQKNPELVYVDDSLNPANYVCKGSQFAIDSTNFHNEMAAAFLAGVNRPTQVIGIADKEYAPVPQLK